MLMERGGGLCLQAAKWSSKMRGRSDGAAKGGSPLELHCQTSFLLVRPDLLTCTFLSPTDKGKRRPEPPNTSSGNRNPDRSYDPDC